MLLPLVAPKRYRFEDFILHGGNEAAVSATFSVLRGSDRPFPSIFLFGPSGTGKTHMLKACCDLLMEREDMKPRRTTAYVSLAPEQDGADRLREIVSAEDETVDGLVALALDDLEPASDETAALIWTLFNRLSRSGAAIILASRLGPSELWGSNPHLESRISAGLVFGLEPPGDTVRMLIVDKLAADRQVRISEDVRRYLVTRKSRNIKDLERLVHILDTASLARKRRITLPFIRSLEAEGLID